jgi:hypothetical protein
LLSAGKYGIAEALVNCLLLTGLAVASILRFGAHDIETIGLVLIVSRVVCGAAILLISAVVGKIFLRRKNRAI